MPSQSPSPKSTYRAQLLALLQEGRKEGVLTNHLTADPLLLLRLPPLPPITDIRKPFTFSDGDRLNTLPPFDPLLEKLTIDAEAVSLIAAAWLKLPTEGAVEEERLLTAEVRRPEDPRIEEPLTRADPVPSIAGLGVAGMDWLPVNTGEDGGLGWSKAVRDNVGEFERKLQVEKLDMTTEVRDFLREVFGGRQVDTNLDELLLEDKRGRRKLPEPLSPPLLPLSARTTPELSPIHLESLDVTPLDADSNADMANSLTNELIEEDSPPQPPPTSFSRFFLDDVDSSSPFRPPSNPQDLKLEIPLSPPPTTKRDHFDSILATNSRLLLPPIETKDEEKEKEPTAESLIEAIARTDTLQLERELEQEQLKEEDSTMRLEVPVMDFTLPRPPWKITEREMEALRDLQSWAGLAAKKWGGSSSLTINMSWSPFTKDAASILEETIEDSSAAERFMISREELDKAEEELVESFDSIHIQDGNSSDEVLEYAVFEKASALDENKGKGKKKDTAEAASFEDLIRKKRKAAADTSQAKNKKKKLSDEDTPSRFSAANSLDAFLTSRALKLPPTPAKPTAQQSPQTPKPAPTPTAPPPPQNPQLYPAPPVPSHLPPTSSIVSTSLLSQRSLFRNIKTLYPSARFIERDFSIPLGNDSILDPTASHSPVETEADLILTPKTGLLLTTLQHLRQRSSLPGQETTFASGKEQKQRILTVSKRYERLLVLISTPQTPSSNDLTVLAELFGFAAALAGECTIIPRIVEGGDEDVARCVVSSMAQAAATTTYKLVEEESVWEQFLRKAGCNAMASQVVLGELKEFGGLRGFLTMGAQERTVRFEGAVGERVWERVEGGLRDWGKGETE